MIKIHEVGLRDGLQNEAHIIDTETKLNWAEDLIDSGVDILQLGSFVHPKRVPQMADSDELFKKIKKKNGIILSGLVLNEKGMQRALDCGADMLCMGVSASETHSKKNTGMTISEALDRIIKMAKEAERQQKKVQVSVQSAFGCGFEGKIEIEIVLKIIVKYLENDLRNISLADTAGHAHPFQVRSMISKIKEIDENIELTAHFHNTYGLALANCVAAYELGVKNFETAFGGLGGCPFTKVAAGNVSTEDFVSFLQRIGIREDINIKKIIEVSNKAAKELNKPMQSYILNAGLIEYKAEE
jgi:hydroxymethylglutaryl-CoA lyase